ncbi:MAG: hypothetical protein U5L09_20915 [Bacteroidales bacterium]|nr:hypothetical protein [Bacteroidales bacterium]
MIITKTGSQGAVVAALCGHRIGVVAKGPVAVVLPGAAFSFS